jgi:hypothetical protein
MKAWTLPATAALLLSACATTPDTAPAPERTAVRPAPPPPAAPPPVEAAEGWADRPLSPGDWSYDASAGEARYAGFSLRCDAGRRQVVVSRAGASGPLRLSTTFGGRILPAGGAIPADDPLLDEIAFSRGRLMVEARGTEPLILPAWPEPARVVQDCRG